MIDYGLTGRVVLITGVNQMSFKDVPDGKWYSDAIRWAAANGIVNGYDADTFGTDDSVTREQIAAILYRSAQAKGQGFHDGWAFPLQFDDADQISGWADEAITENLNTDLSPIISVFLKTAAGLPVLLHSGRTGRSILIGSDLWYNFFDQSAIMNVMDED